MAMWPRLYSTASVQSRPFLHKPSEAKLVFEVRMKTLDRPADRLIRYINDETRTMLSDNTAEPCWIPSRVPLCAPADSRDWPPIVVVSGHHEHELYLRQKMEDTFARSQGRVNVVIIVIQFTPRDGPRYHTIEKWKWDDLEPTPWKLMGSYIVKRNSRRRIFNGVPPFGALGVTQTFGPRGMHLSFKELTRRPPEATGECNINIQFEVLKSMARGSYGR